MSKLEQLKASTTKKELAALLDIKTEVLTYSLYVLKPESQYFQFSIPKKNGGERIISAPSKRLKTIQSNLSKLLLDSIDEINLEKQKPNKDKRLGLAHGFVRNHSIITNAMMHLNKQNVLNIDLDNFFDSFNFGRVRGFFIKNKNFELDPRVATIVAQIACYNNKLPQGSPCSPVITNLITHSLDIRLASLAKKYSCTYSRYADDISFSTRKPVFPAQIMRQEEGGYIAGKKLRSEIVRAGFSINQKKTRIQQKDSRQDVTGLIANKKPNTKKEYWRTARIQCRCLFRTGYFTKKVAGNMVPGNINELEGRLNFIDQVDHYNRLRQQPPFNPAYALRREQNKKLKHTKTYLSGRERTLSQFLYYRLFYGNDKPTILCEGKTDNIYLKSSISELATDYPTLATPKTKDKDYQMLLRFIEYNSRTKFLLELYGGVDYLNGFIESFSKQYTFYSAPKPQHPVIIVLDNDKGPEGLLNQVKNIELATVSPISLDKSKDFRKAEYIHVFHNLYIVLTPLYANHDQTDIESLFDDAARLLKHDGKCFNTIYKRDDKVDLSKVAFAKHVVKAQKKQINFSGLKPLLDRIVKAIDHYDTIK